MLEGCNVALGVTGSIAAVRTVELAHELARNGATVRAVTTPSAEGIIHPWALEFATDHPVVTEITGGVEHVDLCGDQGWADVFVVAPATANSIGKLAHAIDDTPVTTCGTTAIGSGMPVVIAPAMHQPMYDHPGVLEAIEQLEEWGVTFVAPRHAEGKAKIATNESIVTELARATSTDSLAGQHVVVTSGATTEPIDPVRILTNRSSGNMGRAVARAAYTRGAQVTLVHDGPQVSYAAVEQVETGAEMRTAALEAVAEADALVSAAAIGDFTVPQHDRKLDSSEAVELSLEPAPKLLDAVREADPRLTLVGFKAESDPNDETLETAARDLMDRIGAAFVVANDASVMGAEQTNAVIVDEAGTERVHGGKPLLANRIVDRLASSLQQNV